MVGILATTAILSCTAAAQPQAEAGWTSLFDGKTLTGWQVRGGGVYSVDQGTILCLTGTGAYGWLCSEKTYGDFVLEVETKIEGAGNSGVQVRSRIDAKDLMTGYQFDLDRTRPSSGRLYDEARRKLLQDVPLRPEARGALKSDDWNLMRMDFGVTNVTDTIAYSVTNNPVFSMENFSGTTLTNIQNNSVLSILLQMRRTTTMQNVTDTCQVRAKMTRRNIL
jgi:hypothetical protein